ncbi:phosphatidylinositol transfer protein 2-like [Clytia hemisphaerica]|uniref:Phosphatidylinositol transfer protein N-terminal domain-containing protein n=1 Tax=Clytia hemisphaerica TaxID=252671 RepID=A0A7M5WW57_9CNID
MATFLNEYRIRLPFTLEEYQIGQLYSVGEASKDETGGGEGWKWVKNEPFEGVIPHDKGGVPRKGQYTEKILYLGTKFPNQFRCLARQSVFEVLEKSWNCYPYIVTEYTNPSYMKENFQMVITSLHNSGTNIEENVFGLNEGQLKERSVDLLDIVNDFSDMRDFKASEDPSHFQSKKDARGLLKGAYWIHDQPSAVTVYKMVETKLSWNGWESKLNDMFQKTVKRTLLRFNRKVFCSMDQWLSLNIGDVRKFENEVKKELDSKRDQGTVIGTRES